MHPRVLRSIGAGLLCGALAATGIVYAASFSDISGSKNTDAILYLLKKGVISGYSDSTFRPNATVNRAEFVKVLTKAANVDVSKGTYHRCFSDVNDEWFAPYVCFAKSQKWTSGYANGTFKPGNPVTTVEALKMLITAGNCTPMKSTTTSSFTDVLPGMWYTPYIQAASDAGLLQWVTGKTLGVGAGLTRGQMSEMLYRCMIGKEPAVSSSSLSFMAGTTTANSSLWNTLVTAMHRGGGTGTPRVTANTTNGGGTTGDSAPLAPSIVFGDLSKNYGDAPFALSPTSDSSGTFSFESSNTGVATLAGSTVTLLAAGTTTLTVTQAATGNFTSGIKTATLTVLPIAPSITLNSVGKNYGDSAFTVSATSNSAGTFTYDSSNTSVATIIGNTITIVGAGTSTITATQAANGNYASGSRTMTLTVSAIAPTIGTFTNVTKQMGDIPFALTAPTSNSAGAFTYESGNVGIATISGNTVTLVAPGTTTITATQAANGNYTSGVKVMTTFRVVTGQCELEEPCLYGGSCTNGPHGTFSCACIDGHSGPFCDMDASNCDPDGPNNCLNGGMCVPTSAHGECSCAPCFSGARCDEYNCA